MIATYCSLRNYIIVCDSYKAFKIVKVKYEKNSPCSKMSSWPLTDEHIWSSVSDAYDRTVSITNVESVNL